MNMISEDRMKRDRSLGLESNKVVIKQTDNPNNKKVKVNYNTIALLCLNHLPATPWREVVYPADLFHGAYTHVVCLVARQVLYGCRGLAVTGNREHLLVACKGFARAVLDLVTRDPGGLHSHILLVPAHGETLHIRCQAAYTSTLRHNLKGLFE